MFDGLTGRLGDIFDRLRKRGALSEDDVNAALREVRIALLEADVALPAVKAFVTGVKEKAIGTEVLRGINPGQMVIKIVHDHLVELLGSQVEDLNLEAVPPVPILMLGLQGSGKTTTSAKIAVRLKNRDKKKVLLASLDTRRPAAQEQLRILGEQTGVASLPIIAGQQPVEIARRAMEVGRLEGFDVVILDTAGRLAIDEELMAEVVAIRDVANPVESLLVVDAMTGQDAVTVATNFNDRVGITGIVMTRIDGDARGGAALSMRHVTGKPIKLMGMGEKTDALEPFHPDRIAGRILGMGDVVSLVEKAAESIDKEEAEKLAKKLEKGGFDLEDMLSQMRQIRKLGGMGGMMNLLPGMGKIKEQLKNANIDEKILDRQEAIILSMTKKERKKPDILNASRRRRIATGAGVTVADVNRLIKQYQDMSEMMKKMKKMGQKGLLRQGLGALMPKGLR
ncbi:RNA-binding protein [alpha proteobacterium AAP38]|nr:RNA-binding protein [alpha proteobacterium AAP38]